MRSSIYSIGILCIMLTILGIMPLQAQDSKQYAVFNYRNDGQFNAFLNHKIDSITYSCIDTLGVMHDDVVVQEVWTPDSVYRIPLNAIDSLAFHAPETKMRDNLFYIRDYHADYATSIDSLTLYFTNEINADSLPIIGQVVLCVTEKTPFEEGFAGRVREINHRDGQIEVVCGTATLCDVFERLVIAGTAVSDKEEYESRLKARRGFEAGDGAGGGGDTAWDELIKASDHIESIKGLPEEWKATILDLYTMKSKNPRVECFYSVNVTLWDFDVNVDLFIHHDDLTYTLTFDWEKISKMGEKYKKFKEVWDLIKDGDWDAIREKENELDEKSWEEKMKIPFFVGPLNCSFEFGGMLKPEGLDLKISKEEKTSALQHIGLNVKGYTNKYSYWYDKIATAFSESIWDAIEVSKYEVKPTFTFDQEPYSSVNWDVKLTGSFTAGVFARFNVSLLTKYLVRASVSAETGFKLEGTADFKLYDSDYEDVGNENLDANPSASSGIYSVLKDTNVDAKWYAKFKGEAGALPFDLINLSGEKEIKIWEGKFYLVPHFTKPALTTELSGYLRGENEKFTTTVSKDILPLLTCYPGLGIYSYTSSMQGMKLEKVVEYTDTEPYKYIFEEDDPERDEELSFYNKGLIPGTRYYCYPIFKMFNKTFKAGPYITFTYPMPLNVENPSLILQKDVPQLVRINGGWGEYEVDCHPKDVVKAELLTSGEFSQVSLTSLKAGVATVEVRDKRSLEKATIEVKVFSEPEEGTDITVSTTDIDFKSLAYGEKRTKSFSVTNHGSKELTYNIKNSSLGFEVEGVGKVMTLQPGKTETFNVTAMGTGPGQYRMGEIYIYSNATKDPVSIGLKVEGEAPKVEYVDLGLSVKWAVCNLGAFETGGVETGEYIAWGEKDSKPFYGWDTYTHCDGTEASCHNLGNIVGTAYDAAHYQWGGKWRMPTADELSELKERCTWTWDASGPYSGYWVKGPNGNRIFLEAAGAGDGSQVKDKNVAGVYLSGTPSSDDPTTAFMLGFLKDNYFVGEALRYVGASIRPVYDGNMIKNVIKVEPEKIVFGGVEVDASERRYLTIVNNGTEPEEVNVKIGEPYELSYYVENGGGRWYNDLTFSLDPNSRRIIEIHFFPKTVTNYNSEITVTSNGIADGKFVIPVYGSGVVVQEDPSFHLSTNNLEVYVNDDKVVDIYNGSGEYDIINNYPDIVESDINGIHVAHMPKKHDPTETGRPNKSDSWYITGKKVGNAVLKVKDKNTNEVLSLNVDVRRAPSLSLSSKTVELAEGEYDSSIEILSGSGWYTITSSNPEIATAERYYKNLSWVDENGEAHGGIFISIKGLKSGNTKVEVKDMSSGETATISVTVTGDDVPVQTETITIPGTNVSFKMVGVEGGTFWMGSADDDPDANTDEMPRHQVTLNSFAIGETEVTQALWEAVMGSNPSKFRGANHPVEFVYKDECQEFITKLNQLTGRSFRLPTEAEWEYAARGGKFSHGYKYAGSDDINAVAWWYENIPSQKYGEVGYGTQPVGTKQPNELGLYDMSGNVSEWCEDCYGRFYYSESPSVNPCNTWQSNESDMARGGNWSNEHMSWTNNAGLCRVASRGKESDMLKNNHLGLRLALAPTLFNVSCPDGHHPHMIDLGLPDGTLWACCNVDATKPEEYGGYYAWGETETKANNYTDVRQTYDYDNYQHAYIDDNDKSGHQDWSTNHYWHCKNLGDSICGTNYDVAYVKSEKMWHMPTVYNFEILKKYCSYENYTMNGIEGFLFVGRNGGAIFMPFAEDNKGEYWTANPCPKDLQRLFVPAKNLSYSCQMYASYIDEKDDNERYKGKSIRPVYDSHMPPLYLSTSKLNLTPDGQVTVNVTCGSGSYDAVSNSTSVATVTVEGSMIIVNAVAVGSATITVKDNQTQKREKIEVTVSNPLSCPDGHHPHILDLGLPSGTKWACCNVGADKPESFGGHFAWGEVKEKENVVYDWNTYEYSDVNLGSDISGTEYDVAHVQWGGNWQMPSKEQLLELSKYCNHKWMTLNGVPGRMITSEINGGTIFLPAAGCRDYDSIEVGYSGTGCYYWSSTSYPYNDYSAYRLITNNAYSTWDVNWSRRNLGCSVRPVMSPNGKPDNDVGGSPGNGDGTSGGSDPTHDEYDDF